MLTGRLRSPDKRTIQASHYNIFSTWLTAIHAKFDNQSAFMLFVDWRRIVDLHPLLLYTVQSGFEGYFRTKLFDKTHVDVLKSLLCWSLSLKCENPRCRPRPKIDCYCDIQQFPRFTYELMMVTIRCGYQAADEDDEPEADILQILLDGLDRSEEETVSLLCELLPDEQAKHPFLEAYKKHLICWLQQDFFNFTCLQCGAVNDRSSSILRLQRHPVRL